ncbi:MAG: hypothetical protein ACI94Y_001087 [Maribacter sp.]|jgi:hypothetical protein
MKNIIYTFLCLVFIYSCSMPVQDSDSNKDSTEIEDNSTETVPATTENDGKEVDVVSDESEEIETENYHLIEKKDLSELEYLMTFIPKDHLVLDYEYGDLDKDDLKKDVILISYSKKEQTDDSYEGKRNLYILSRTTDGKLESKGMNDEIVLCKDCGGAMGDPYIGISIKNGYFSAEHHGGSNWRWTRIMTFKYDAKKKDWFLHKDGGVSYLASDPDKMEEEVSSVKDFGVVAFNDFKGSN